MAIKTIQLPNGQEIVIDEWLHWPLYSSLVGQGNIPASPGNGASIDLKAFTYVVGERIPRAGNPVDPTGTNFVARTSDTNQVVKSRINHDEALVVFSITYEMFALDHDVPFGDPLAPDVQTTSPIFRATNLRQMQMQCMLELLVASNLKKPQIRGPFSWFSQGLGAVAYTPGQSLAVNFTPTGGGANVTNLALNYGTGGPVTPRNQRRYYLPVYVHSDKKLQAHFWSPGGVVQGLDQSWKMRITLDGIKRRPVG